MRKFLWQQDEGTTRSSTGVPAPRVGEPPKVTTEQVHRAQLAVARGALDAADCRLLLDMLGLTPEGDDPPAVCR
jgi:hypothetical protein